LVYVELWFDAEKDHEWKITLWKIANYDFDPLTTPYITLDTGIENQHRAREAQLAIVRDLKKKNETVVANAYMLRSRFSIRPKWLEELLSPIGHINARPIHPEKELKNLIQEYTIWFGGVPNEEIFAEVQGSLS